MKLPPLDDNQQRLLREVVGQGIVRGGELMRATGMKADELITTAKPLLKYDLIEVSGNPFDEEEVMYAVFSVRPSDTEFLKYSLS